MPNYNKALFLPDKDLCYHLDERYQRNLDWILRKSGATLQVLSQALSRISKTVADDYMVKISGNKIHEYRPNINNRTWIYISTILVFTFFTLNIIDYYFIKTRVLTYIGLAFMIPAMLIQFLFIYRNGKIFKKNKQAKADHSSAKVEKIRNVLNEILPEINRKIKPYGLVFSVKIGSYIELKFDSEIIVSN